MLQISWQWELQLTLRAVVDRVQALISFAQLLQEVNLLVRSARREHLIGASNKHYD